MKTSTPAPNTEAVEALKALLERARSGQIVRVVYLPLALAGAVLASGCAQNTIYKDPTTGQVQQCTTNVPPTLPLIAQADIDKCGKTFESMGWKKQ